MPQYARAIDVPQLLASMALELTGSHWIRHQGFVLQRRPDANFLLFGFTSESLHLHCGS